MPSVTPGANFMKHFVRELNSCDLISVPLMKMVSNFSQGFNNKPDNKGLKMKINR